MGYKKLSQEQELQLVQEYINGTNVNVLMDKYGLAGDVTYTLGLGNLTNDGIYAAMSILFCLVSLAVVIIVLLAIRKLVFYRDE